MKARRIRGKREPAVPLLPLVVGASVRRAGECPCSEAGEVLKVRPCGSVVVDWPDWVEDLGPEEAKALRVDAPGAVCDWHPPGWLCSGYHDLEQTDIARNFTNDPDAVVRWRTPQASALIAAHAAGEKAAGAWQHAALPGALGRLDGAKAVA